MELKRQLGLRTSILVVIASMIGTGIFITTGTTLFMTKSAPLVFILWLIGGVIALTGSLCYAELATMWPHVGGEYIYLKKAYGLLPSFLSGWISLAVGFSASVAVSSITLIQYLDSFLQSVSTQLGQTSYILSGPLAQKFFASLVLLVFGVIHIHGVKSGSRIQNILTILKLLVVISFIIFGLSQADWTRTDRLSATFHDGSDTSIGGMLPVTGLALLVIMFSYSGWNGATYIAGEIKNAEKNLPKALFFGTLFTMLLYLGLNVVFIISSPGLEIMGKDTIGSTAAANLFGHKLSNLFTLGISFIMLSSISVQMMIGPRVYYAMARDNMIFSALSRVSPKFHTPTVSILIQMALAIFYVLVGNAPLLMEYMGFSLSLFPILTVIGLVYMRYRHPDITRPFRVPFFPFLPAVFILLSTGMMIAGFMAWTETSRFALLAMASGVPVFFIWRWYYKKFKPGQTPPADELYRN